MKIQLAEPAASYIRAVNARDSKAFIDLYFQQFPGVRGFMERTLDDARRTGEVRTLFGRRRQVANLGSQNHGDKAAAERIAVEQFRAGVLDRMGRDKLALDSTFAKNITKIKSGR